MTEQTNVEKLVDAKVVKAEWLSAHMTDEINTKLSGSDIDDLIQMRGLLEDDPDPNVAVF